MSTPFVQQLSGLIHEFFLSYKAPSWFYVGPALKLFKIQHFHGLSNLDEDFLRFFFKDDVNLLKLIPEMRYCHHQLIILLLKEEYNLASCSACGAISKMHRYNFRRRIDSYSNLSQPELNGIYKRLKKFFINLFLKCCAGVEEDLDGENIPILTDQEKEVEEKERSIDEVDKAEQLQMDTIQSCVSEEEECLILSVCDDDKKEINN